jgi:hypothetical protein
LFSSFLIFAMFASMTVLVLEWSCGAVFTIVPIGRRRQQQDAGEKQRNWKQEFPHPFGV